MFDLIDTLSKLPISDSCQAIIIRSLYNEVEGLAIEKIEDHICRLNGKIYNTLIDRNKEKLKLDIGVMNAYKDLIIDSIIIGYECKKKLNYNN